MTLVRKEGLDMPSKVEVGRGDIRAQTLACLGVGLALIAALGMFLLTGPGSWQPHASWRSASCPPL
jgi:hypothetical protein